MKRVIEHTTICKGELVDTRCLLTLAIKIEKVEDTPGKSKVIFISQIVRQNHIQAG